MKKKEETNDRNDMEIELNQLLRERVGDLANTANLLGGWMAEQKLTIAEQLTVTELLRSSILVNYMQKAQINEMLAFVKDHPEAQVVVAAGSKMPAPGNPHTSHPNSN